MRSLHPGDELLDAARALAREIAGVPDRVSDGLPDVFPGWTAPEFQ